MTRLVKPGSTVVAVLVALVGVSVCASSASADTEWVSVAVSGDRLNGESYEASVSGDGRLVAFVSAASNLVAGDSNDSWDVFVRDREAGTTERVSIDSAGGQADGFSFEASISADGRYVAFLSSAADLVPDDTNGWIDVFVHDRATGRTELASVSSAGAQINDRSEEPRISADGRYVVFASGASNVVAGDTNGSWDVFVHDLETGGTERVSVDSAGGQADRPSFSASISADGRHVAFASAASNLVPGGSSRFDDVFVHDRVAGETELVSVDSAGGQANQASFRTSISADGRHVAFDSAASNLVSGDTNGSWDVFVHDRETGETGRVSVDRAGGQVFGDSWAPSISAHGRQVAFNSDASSVVPGDTNGTTDVFVRDLEIARTERASVDDAGREGNRESYDPSISADGVVVAFSSLATNLLTGDTNAEADVFVHIREGGPEQPPPPEACTITGTPGDDVLTGTTGFDVICGLGGDDVISGRSGDDVLRGGDGADDLSGGAGDDRVEGGGGADKLSGSLGDDALSGGLDDDRVYGREGLDTVSGDDGDDVLSGSVGDDTVRGGAGHDDLYGGEGADALLGEDGDDSLHGDEGPDELVGGEGADEASYSSRLSPVQVTIGDGADDGDAGEGDDVEISVEQVRGGHADDRLVGSFSDNLLSGGAGDDVLVGAGGWDELSGGDGDDRLDAVTDDDESVDRLRCGGGLDTALSEMEDLVSSSCETR